jgi:hypothetical protein
MTVQRAPQRWNEAPPEPLASAFADAAADYATAGPEVAARERMWQALQAKLASQPAHVARAPRAVGQHAAGLAFLVGLIGVVAWLGLQPRTADAPAPRSPPAGDVEHAPVPATTPSRVLPKGAPSQPAAASPTNAPAAVAGPTVPSGRSLSTPLGVDASASELKLLTHARRVVRSAPHRALALTREHAKHYPSGLFAEEREVVAIDALHALGQHAAAAKRARRFARAYPMSVHRGRLEGGTDAP